MKRVIGFAIGLALVVAGAVGAGAAGVSHWMTQHVSGAETVVSGCVLRFDTPDGKPQIHANYSHQCAGVESVGINDKGEVTVRQTIPTNRPIIAALAQADETLASRGIQAGASGGGPVTNFRLYDSKLGRTLDLRKAGDRKRVQGKYANLWVMWIHGPAH